MADVDITAELEAYQTQRTELIDAERRLRHGTLPKLPRSSYPANMRGRL